MVRPQPGVATAHPPLSARVHRITVSVPEGGRQPNLPGLAPDELPLHPRTTTFVLVDGKGPESVKVRRTAYPLASAKCADLADSMGLSKDVGSMLFYTLVSRVRKLGDIAFLRKFDIDLVRQKPSDDLMDYFKHLEELAETTQKRVTNSRHRSFRVTNTRHRGFRWSSGTRFYGSSYWTKAHDQEAAGHLVGKAMSKRREPYPCCVPATASG